ncbi:MAG: hypothetical protein LUQ59_03510, partial [Methanothrix sp.]|nr:hypothetical protein [Methanothrix sp.]
MDQRDLRDCGCICTRVTSASSAVPNANGLISFESMTAILPARFISSRWSRPEAGRANDLQLRSQNRFCLILLYPADSGLVESFAYRVASGKKGISLIRARVDADIRNVSIVINRVIAVILRRHWKLPFADDQWDAYGADEIVMGPDL